MGFDCFSVGGNGVTDQSLTTFALARFAQRLAGPAVASAATTTSAATATRGIGAFSALGCLEIGDFGLTDFLYRSFGKEFFVDRGSFFGAGGSGELLAGESHEPPA
jgi:hypothetical protein